MESLEESNIHYGRLQNILGISPAFDIYQDASIIKRIGDLRE